ncbi:hypothetical protein [Jiella avicenniae]|uniref:Uncharacterized protein n=1 Tax=Jiella avicenniae TaxID=2907202 RepID=A0A9X1T4M7_9HYPH|nr:hypothetical protein [Jiella avicenniae]MCE7028137.1 hypothetical protein [Jiella avicenniae]
MPSRTSIRCARLALSAAALAAGLMVGTVPAVAYDLYDHNGSLMRLDDSGGRVTIRYETPKRGLAKHGVRPGTVLFRGRFEGRGLAGVAYVFRQGCEPAAYNVAGPATGGGTIYLTGAAPIRAKGSCRVTGYSENSGNARLVFEEFQGDD